MALLSCRVTELFCVGKGLSLEDHVFSLCSLFWTHFAVCRYAADAFRCRLDVFASGVRVLMKSFTCHTTTAWVVVPYSIPWLSARAEVHCVVGTVDFSLECWVVRSSWCGRYSLFIITGLICQWVVKLNNKTSVFVFYCLSYLVLFLLDVNVTRWS